MEKMPCVFMREDESARNSPVSTVPNPLAQWVLDGEGTPTRKFDGTCCMISRSGAFFKRYQVRPGKSKPSLWIPTGEPDPKTGKQQGWIPVDPCRPENKWHLEAFAALEKLSPGTYELVGPKVQGNPEQFESHVLIPHGKQVLEVPKPWTYDTLKEWIQSRPYEGIVWWHPDGRKAKLRKKDF